MEDIFEQLSDFSIEELKELVSHANKLIREKTMMPPSEKINKIMKNTYTNWKIGGPRICQGDVAFKTLGFDKMTYEEFSRLLTDHIGSGNLIKYVKSHCFPYEEWFEQYFEMKRKEWVLAQK